MQHGSSARKFFTPKIHDVDEVIKKATVTRQPQKVFVHVGTNNLMKDDLNDDAIEAMQRELDNMFGVLRRAFPDSTIYVSSILIRKDVQFKDAIIQLNEFLEQAVLHSSKFVLVKHSNISEPEKMLRDDRHLSNAGFARFLANIRWVLFGIMPRLRRMGTHNTRDDDRYYRPNYRSFRPRFYNRN